MPRDIIYREAVREAMTFAMRENPEVFLMGEDVGVYGGAFGVSRGVRRGACSRYAARRSWIRRAGRRGGPDENATHS